MRLQRLQVGAESVVGGLSGRMLACCVLDGYGGCRHRGFELCELARGGRVAHLDLPDLLLGRPEVLGEQIDGPLEPVDAEVMAEVRFQPECRRSVQLA